MTQAYQYGAQLAQRLYETHQPGFSYANGAALARRLLARPGSRALVGQDDEANDCPCPEAAPQSTMKALFHITLPDGDGDDPEVAEERHFAPIWLALNAMANINEWHIRRSIKRAQRGICAPIPPLFASGVRYKEDPPGREDWKDCYAVMADGWADCDRLVAWRVAELRVAGINAEPVLKWQRIPKQMMLAIGHPSHLVPKDGVDMVHCMVRFPDGRIEDTSKLLGMGGEYTSAI